MSPDSSRHGSLSSPGFPIAADEHLLAVLRYVERNPLRAGVVARADQWRWGSLYRRMQGTAEERALMAESPVPLGRQWCEHVNEPQSEAELEAIQRCVARGQPFGRDAWRSKVARQPGLEYTLRPRGRPRKQRFDPTMLDERLRSKRRAVRTPTYDDVTKPLYARAIGRWRNYERYLEPGLRILQPFLDALGYA